MSRLQNKNNLSIKINHYFYSIYTVRLNLVILSLNIFYKNEFKIMIIRKILICYFKNILQLNKYSCLFIFKKLNNKFELLKQ